MDNIKIIEIGDETENARFSSVEVISNAAGKPERLEEYRFSRIGKGRVKLSNKRGAALFRSTLAGISLVNSISLPNRVWYIDGIEVTTYQQWLASGGDSDVGFTRLEEISSVETNDSIVILDSFVPKPTITWIDGKNTIKEITVRSRVKIGSGFAYNSIETEIHLGEDGRLSNKAGVAMSAGQVSCYAIDGVLYRVNQPVDPQDYNGGRPAWITAGGDEAGWPA